MLHHQLALGYREPCDLCGDQREISPGRLSALQTGAVFQEPAKIPPGIGIIQSEDECRGSILS